MALKMVLSRVWRAVDAMLSWCRCRTEDQVWEMDVFGSVVKQLDLV